MPVCAAVKRTRRVYPAQQNFKLDFAGLVLSNTVDFARPCMADFENECVALFLLHQRLNCNDIIGISALLILEG